MSEKTTRKKAAAPAVEEKKAVVCKGHNQMHMCFNCSDNHCKEQGFFKMHRCKGFFFWRLALMSMAIVLVIAVATLMIARIVDGAWHDLRLPLALLTGVIAYAIIAFAICAIVDYKHRTGSAVYE